MYKEKMAYAGVLAKANVARGVMNKRSKVFSRLGSIDLLTNVAQSFDNISGEFDFMVGRVFPCVLASLTCEEVRTDLGPRSLLTIGTTCWFGWTYSALSVACRGSRLGLIEQ